MNRTRFFASLSAALVLSAGVGIAATTPASSITATKTHAKDPAHPSMSHMSAGGTSKVTASKPVGHAKPGTQKMSVGKLAPAPSDKSASQGWKP